MIKSDYGFHMRKPHHTIDRSINSMTINTLYEFPSSLGEFCLPEASNTSTAHTRCSDTQSIPQKQSPHKCEGIHPWLIVDVANWGRVSTQPCCEVTNSHRTLYHSSERVFTYVEVSVRGAIEEQL